MAKQRFARAMGASDKAGPRRPQCQPSTPKSLMRKLPRFPGLVCSQFDNYQLSQDLRWPTQEGREGQGRAIVCHQVVYGTRAFLLQSYLRLEWGLIKDWIWLRAGDLAQGCQMIG